MFNRFLVLAVVLAACEAAAGQPSVSPFELLPGDADIAAAPGDQRTPTAVKGEQHTLLVWYDRVEIHAQRLNAEGNPVDEAPIVIGRDRIDNNSILPRPPGPPPAVAWNGQHWLIVYRGQTVAANGGYFTNYLFGVRVAPDGTIVDQTRLTIRRSEDVDPGGSQEPGHATVAAGADGAWLVAWPEYGGPYTTVLRAHRVSGGGELLTAEPLTLTSTAEDARAGEPRASGTASGYLLTWRDGHAHDSHADVFGRSYDAQMNPLAPVFRLGSADAQRYVNALHASGPDGLLVVAQTPAAALYGFRVPQNSTAPADTAGVAFVGTSAQSVARTYGASFDGQNWALAYSDPRPNFTGSALRVRRFAPDLAPVDPQPLEVPLAPGYPDAMSHIDVTTGQLPGGAVAVLWHDNAVPADHNIWLSRLLSGHGPGVRRLVTGELPTQSAGGVATAPDGSGAVALWSSTAERRAILVQRFGPDGEIIDAEPITVATATFGQSAGTPDIAFNGSVYTIVWPAGNRAMARRMTPSGTFLDPEPVPVLPVNETSLVNMLGVSVAAIDDIALVTGYSRQSFNRPYVRYARVRVSDMTVLDPGAPVMEFNINQLGGFGTPQVTAVGPAGAQRFLVAFTDVPSAGPSNVDVVFVSPDGTSTPAGSIGSAGAASPTVASIGDRALVVYRGDGPDGTDLFGRIFNSAGVAETPETLIVSAPGTQTSPQLTTDESGYLLAWSDFRHEAGGNPLDPSFSDPWAARLDADGASLDGTGFPLRVSPTSELSIRLASVGLGRFIALYQARTPEVPAVYRVGRQFIDGSGGPVCTADWNGDEAVNSGDISAFLTDWLASVQGGTLVADFNADMAVNSADISAFLTSWLGAVQDGC